MSFHDGSPLFAKIIRLRESQAWSELELSNGEIIIWTGSGALAIGRQLEATIKAGKIRNLLVPAADGEIQQVHVGPDAAVEHIFDKSERQ